MNRRQILTGTAAVVAAPLVKHIPEISVEVIGPERQMILFNGSWYDADKLTRMYEMLWNLERIMIEKNGHDTWGRATTLAEWEEKHGKEPPIFVIRAKDVTPDPVTLAA